MIQRLVTISVPAGAHMESQSGLQMNNPRVYGNLCKKEGGNPDTVFVLMHPTSNFHGHYLLEPLTEAGYAVFALNSRYVNNDSVLIMERVLLDLGEGIKFLKSEGFKRIVLIGNSGGGELMSFYQSQAENPTITHTPAGDELDLTKANLIPGDALILLAAHPGRARTLTDWLDASVVDESNPYITDPDLDMFCEKNGPPYSIEFLKRYRQAQIERNRKITRWVKSQLEYFREINDPDKVDMAFIVHRTMADPRFEDLSIDPSDRERGALWGPTRKINFSANNLGRFTTLKSWLSQWSLEDSNADGVRNISKVSVPVFIVAYTADQAVFPMETKDFFDSVQHNKKDLAEIKGGNHYLLNQPDQIMEVSQKILDWVKKY
ncbi:hypothetical protein V7124_08965 [Neobacillus niacini]|uniref:alpha/beta hydrolase n=1 Tax=Neobacillus niacini TaxID=86668 RepID=UPI002FFF5CC3